jgi:hypothetical protein
MNVRSSLIFKNLFKKILKITLKIFSPERTPQTSSLIFNLKISPQCLRLLKNFKFLAFKEKQAKSKSLFFALQTMFE